MPFAALLGAACVLAALLTAGPPPVRGQAGPIPSPSFPPFTVTPPVAPTPIPLDQTAAVSSGSGVQPGGSVTFVDAPPNAAHPLVGAVRLRVENHGDQQASAFYDGLTLEVSTQAPGFGINVSAGAALCTPLDGRLNSVGCHPLTGGPAQTVTFTTPFEPNAAFPSPFFTPLSHQAMLAPGAATLSAAGSEVLFFPAGLVGGSGPAPTSLGVRNLSEATDAAISDDGTTLTIAVPAGLDLVATGVLFARGDVTLPCLRVDGQANVLVCTHGSPLATTNLGQVWFDAVPEPSSGSSLAQAVVYEGDTVTLALPAADGGSPRLVAIQGGPFPAGFGRPGEGSDALAIDARWDGATLTLTGPPGYRLSIEDPFFGCASPAGQPEIVNCPTTQTGPLLLSALSDLIGVPPRTGGPPPRGPVWQARLLSAPEALSVGESGSFSGEAGVRYRGETAGPFDYFFLWGDGMADTGPAASHAFATPGDYAVTLLVFDESTGAYGVAITTVVVTLPGG